MNVLDAAYHTVHSYPGGSSALAPRIGKVQQALNSELNPNMHTHKLGLADAMRLIVLTGDHSIIHAMCAEVGLVAVPVDGADTGSDILSLLLAKQSASGDFAQTLRETLADGRVTANELRRLTTQAMRKIELVNSVLAQLQSMQQAPGA